MSSGTHFFFVTFGDLAVATADKLVMHVLATFLHEANRFVILLACCKTLETITLLNVKMMIVMKPVENLTCSTFTDWFIVGTFG